MPGGSTVPIGNAANAFCLQFAVAAGAALSAPTATERSYTVPGLRVGDICFVVKPTFQSGIGIGNVRVSATDTLSVTFVCTNGTPTLTAENYFLMVLRSSYDNPTAQLPTAIV